MPGKEIGSQEQVQIFISGNKDGVYPLHSVNQPVSSILFSKCAKHTWVSELSYLIPLPKDILSYPQLPAEPFLLHSCFYSTLLYRWPHCNSIPLACLISFCTSAFPECQTHCVIHSCVYRFTIHLPLLLQNVSSTRASSRNTSWHMAHTQQIFIDSINLFPRECFRKGDSQKPRHSHVQTVKRMS